MSTGFGQWYEEQKAAENGDDSASSSWSEGLPLFNSENAAKMMDFSSIRASMEAQMPKKLWGMDYAQRFRMFCALLLLSALFFALGFFVGLPTIAIRPQKFALCFTFGSLMFMMSFGLLTGPMEHLRSFLAPDRIVFTTVYFLSMITTLWCTFNVSGFTGYVVVMGSSGLQIVALLWYLISFLPGGSAGLSVVIGAIGRILQPVIVQCARLQGMILSRCLGMSS
uniref:Vesicle transport protein n=1 Tax=Grammatophora oceanica TaxID=210454 RepID=A0A7S1YEU8_9STRA|mmetsp:Transcript_46878/g.69706  ORF Transcript_46878/g.69706 Transcript_46878/m.69706 type:complete len:224 (+) Transcript_46878:74-745(+)